LLNVLIAPIPSVLRLLIVVVIVGSAGFIPSYALAQTGNSDPTLEGEILLRISSSASLPSLLTNYELEEIDQYGSRPIYRLNVTGLISVAETIEALELDPEVIAAEPNPIMQSPEARRNAAWAIGEESDYTAQWAPARIRLGEAHALSTGSRVRVALLDTGVDRLHPALDGRLVRGWDFVDNDNDPSETGSTENAGYGHGTHVAGLVALVAPESRIMPLRVLDPDGVGDTWVIAKAVIYAVDPDQNPLTRDGARVINLSLGTLDRSEILSTVVGLATCTAITQPGPPGDPRFDFTDPGYDNDKDRCSTSRGAVVVSAAGNDASKSLRQYPAAAGVYGMISVGASDITGSIASFSNFGSWVDVLAPGDGITSLIPGGIYGTWSGTSMAAPFVTGTAALLISRYPGVAPRQVTRRIERTSTELCGVDIPQIDVAAALGDAGTGGPPCP
jgi:subtilisin family serine protease